MYVQGMPVPNVSWERLGNSCPEIHQHPLALFRAKAETHPSLSQSPWLEAGLGLSNKSVRLEAQLLQLGWGRGHPSCPTPCCWRGPQPGKLCGPCTRHSAGSSRITSTHCRQPSGDTSTYKVVLSPPLATQIAPQAVHSEAARVPLGTGMGSARLGHLLTVAP